MIVNDNKIVALNFVICGSRLVDQDLYTSNKILFNII